MANGKLLVPEGMRQYCSCDNCNPWKECSDAEFDWALGITNARFYQRFYPGMLDVDLDRIIVQGKPLRFWLNELKRIDGEKKNVESKRA